MDKEDKENPKIPWNYKHQPTTVLLLSQLCWSLLLKFDSEDTVGKVWSLAVKILLINQLIKFLK